MERFEDSPILDTVDTDAESTTINHTDNLISESDNVVVVTPVGVIQTVDENEYKNLSNGLNLNNIHDFTYNGLNLEQRIYQMDEDKSQVKENVWQICILAMLAHTWQQFYFL